MSGMDSNRVTNRRRLFMLASLGAMTGIVVAAACSFPEPSIVPDEGGTTTDGTTTDTSSGGPDDGPSGDGNAFKDVVEPDSPPPIDASGERPDIDANGCLCDCDKDGYRSVNQDAAACDAGFAKEIDCDDLDPRAHPNAGFVDAAPTPQTQGDWNCDGVVNREVPAVNVNCAALGALSGCSSAEGFVDDPGCGEAKSYVTCKVVNVTGCANATNIVKVQGCK